MMKRILLGIGGTPFTAVAIEQAVALASAHGARITAVTAVDPNHVCKLGPVPAGGGHYAKRMCDNRLEVTKNHIDQSIAALETSCSASGVTVDVARESGDTFDLLIDYARYHDLTLFGIRSIFEYQLMEEPEKDLIRLLSQGVRPILAVSNQSREVKRAMIAYSGSMESAKAMRRFVQFKLWPAAKLEIVHFGSQADDARRLLDPAAAYCRDHGYAVDTHDVSGTAKEQLLARAQQLDVDLIVMGNSIRKLWLRKVLGDTVLHVLTHADRPIFLSQ